MLKIIDIFAGAGGLSIGFEMAGFQPTVAVEIDQLCVSTYKAHSSNTFVESSDARTIDFIRFKNDADIVVGGPPCQPFSTGGLRKAHLDARDMVPEFIRAVKEIEPDAFVMENVSGLASGSRKLYLNEILEAFRCLGYYVSNAVLKAEEFGVPQRRRRLFIVGSRKPGFSFPLASHGPSEGQNEIVLAGDVLTAEPQGNPNNSKVFYAKKVDIRPSPYHGLLFNGGGRAIDLLQPSATIISSAGGNKTHFIDTLNIVPEYHKYLLNGGKPKTGEVPGCRRITTLESARLQTFPDEVSFSGPQSAQYRQIGNAVPPLLAKAVAISLKNHLIGIVESPVFQPEYCEGNQLQLI